MYQAFSKTHSRYRKMPKGITKRKKNFDLHGWIGSKSVMKSLPTKGTPIKGTGF